MFIFDKFDVMPSGLIDTIIPYLDDHDNLNGINYRKAVFIFISNTAATEIQHQTISFLHEGKERDSIQLKDMEVLVTKAAANLKAILVNIIRIKIVCFKSGNYKLLIVNFLHSDSFYHIDVLLRYMITAYIPFLPLERKHVRQCIKDYLLLKKYYTSYGDIPEEKVREIAEQLHYFPEEEQLFSTTGCKRVPSKTCYIMEED
ncbi:torsin-1A-like [Mytilus galloprovincialis]|uniref:torsin-1A-like n=1 Tax=Mytilus galloprovincialis TaxID=29158 RepID=UPI003F7C79A2